MKENTRLMRNFFKSKIFILLFTLVIANLFSGQSQVYARKSEKDTKNTRQTKSITTQCYTVSLDGTGDFTSIQEAANHAKNGDTLIIYPGIYTENLVINDKALTITGIDKNSCILQYDTFSYLKVPLTIAAGSVSNLTIYGINNGTQPDAFFFDEYLSANLTENADSQMQREVFEHQKNHAGYAIHIDASFLYGKEIKFRNCKIISENNHCVGIGSWGNSKIGFEDCEIISTGNGGCIFLHDCTLPEFQGNVNFTMKNCQLTSYLNPYVMSIENLGPYNPTYLTFQNVKVSSVAFDYPECYAPYNVHTGFDVDTLMLLDNSNQLESSGFTSTVMHNMVHELSLQESLQYIETIGTLYEHKNPTVNYNILPEGITYIKSHDETNADSETSSTNGIKKSVLNLQNASLQAGTGWYGLNNVYLTPDSYGNTLIEMNHTNFNGLVVTEEPDLLENIAETTSDTEVEIPEDAISDKENLNQTKDIEKTVSDKEILNPNKNIKKTGSETESSNQDTDTPVNEEVEHYIIIKVEKGNGSEIVSRRLYNAGLVNSTLEYDSYLIKNGYDRKIKVGNHEIPTNATYEEIAKILCGMR